MTQFVEKRRAPRDLKQRVRFWCPKILRAALIVYVGVIAAGVAVTALHKGGKAVADATWHVPHDLIQPASAKK